MSTHPRLSPTEQRAYDRIVSAEEIYQSDLWKALQMNSRAGSRVAHSLAEKALITRERTVHNGHTTYRLQPGSVGGTDESVDHPHSGQMSPTRQSREDTGVHLTSREEQALSLIQRTGELYQSELWKELAVSSRTGTRIATTLEKAGLIERNPAVHDGRHTYLLTPVQQDLDFSLLMAGDSMSPFIGTDDVDPHSKAFTEWLFQLSHDADS